MLASQSSSDEAAVPEYDVVSTGERLEETIYWQSKLKW
jgi:hypothetical protein